MNTEWQIHLSLLITTSFLSSWAFRQVLMDRYYLPVIFLNSNDSEMSEAEVLFWMSKMLICNLTNKMWSECAERGIWGSPPHSIWKPRRRCQKERNSDIKEFLQTVQRLPYHFPTRFSWARGCCSLNFPFDMGCSHSAKSHFINTDLNAERKLINYHFA